MVTIAPVKCQRCLRESGPVFGRGDLKQCSRCKKLVCPRCVSLSVPVGKITLCKDCTGAALPRT
ncbi:MAG TPA: hypothetical protein VM490_19825 [Armatimonadaceae bacterium]|nr:hypothetical protein [Armatimonadaceae bacterium]